MYIYIYSINTTILYYCWPINWILIILFLLKLHTLSLFEIIFYLQLFYIFVSNIFIKQITKDKYAQVW